MAFNYSNPARPFPDQRGPQGRPPPQQQQGYGRGAPQQGGNPQWQQRPRQNTQGSEDGYYGNGFWAEYGIEDQSPPRQPNGPAMRNGNFSRPQQGPPGRGFDGIRGPPPDQYGGRGPSRQGNYDRQAPPNGYGPNGPNGPQGRGFNRPPGPPGPGYGPPNGRGGPNLYPPNAQRLSPPRKQSEYRTEYVS
jgi:hypothetical protein